MVSTSTIASFRAALYTALSTNVSLAGVQVVYGEIEAMRSESISLSDTVTATYEGERLQSGRRKRHELVEHELVIDVDTKTTPQASEARAVALLAIVEDVLASDPISNPTWVAGAWSVKPMRLDMTTTQGQLVRTVITLTIEVTARLT